MPLARRHPSGTFATRRALIGPGDAELFHLLLQSGTLHLQAARGPFRTAHHPAGFAEDAEDVLPFGVGQRTSGGPGQVQQLALYMSSTVLAP